MTGGFQFAPEPVTKCGISAHPGHHRVSRPCRSCGLDMTFTFGPSDEGLGWSAVPQGSSELRVRDYGEERGTAGLCRSSLVPRVFCGCQVELLLGWSMVRGLWSAAVGKYK